MRDEEAAQLDFKSYVRTIENFPKPGISFKDITTLLNNKEAFHAAIETIARHFEGKQIDIVTGPEARGYIFASALAYRLGAGFVPVRKPGKLPYKTKRISYALEYGEDALEVHEDAFLAGQRVLVVDDLLATGGTIRATIDLVESFDAKVEGVGFMIELAFLNGRKRLDGYDLMSLIQY
ncbi:MAG: adenine phosphoribosyltransferase [Symbiobacteriaceae bacterium]|jgi:adenine phosphoribosyltransferase|nr:adenine phosphoribosyltransferase [Symbiobacteriaceae bacterium]